MWLINMVNTYAFLIGLPRKINVDDDPIEWNLLVLSGIIAVFYCKIVIWLATLLAICSSAELKKHGVKITVSNLGTVTGIITTNIDLPT